MLGTKIRVSLFISWKLDTCQTGRPTGTGILLPRCNLVTKDYLKISQICYMPPLVPNFIFFNEAANKYAWLRSQRDTHEASHICQGVYNLTKRRIKPIEIQWISSPLRRFFIFNFFFPFRCTWDLCFSFVSILFLIKLFQPCVSGVCSAIRLRRFHSKYSHVDGMA